MSSAWWWATVFAVIAWGACGISYRNLRKVNKAGKRMKEAFEFYRWAKESRIVVRDKLEHREMVDLTVWELYRRFERGDVFRNATMLYDNTEFKVYAQGKTEEE